MNTILSQLLLSLILGLGFFLGSVTFLSIKAPRLALATELVRYVAPAPFGSDGDNDCLAQADPCATVQHAVNQATSGDEIRVASGIYRGTFTRTELSSVVTQAVYINKSLTVRGGYTTTDWDDSNPVANFTILDAQGMGRVINIEDPAPSTPISVTIEGLRLENGNAKGQASPSGPEGGGGLHSFGGTVTLRNNYIAHNHGSQAGGGILLVGNGPFMLINNTIVTNALETSSDHALGGGVSSVIYPGGTGITLIGNLIRGNTAKVNNPVLEAKGGGIYILADDDVVALSDNIIQANQVEMAGSGTGQGGGGGIYVVGGQAAMINTVVADNQIVGQGFGAGIFVSGGQVNLLHLTLARNGGGDESGLNVRSGTVTLTNTVLVSHSIGITVETGSAVTINGILWFDNSLSNTAGAGTINLNNEHTGNPAFMADGYHLKINSAAIDKGINAGVMTDIDGQLRDLNRPDLGADEAIFSFLPVILRTS